MRIALVVNPKSGSAPNPDEAADALRSHGAEVVELVRWPGELRGDDAERVVVVSGDGLVAPIAERAGRLGVPLAVVPGGTANDFAHAMGIPADAREALRLAATGTADAPMELARIGDRPFVNVVGVGLAPEAGKQAAPHKAKLGPLAYPVGALVAGLWMRPLGARVLVDGRELYAGPIWQVTVASSGAFGGGSTIREADPHDGRLDALVLPGGSRATLPLRALGMRQGTLAEQPGVRHERGRVVELVVVPGTPLNVDGELVAARGVDRLAVRRDAFRLVTA